MTGSWMLDTVVLVACLALLSWLVLVAGLLVAYPGRVPVRELLRLLPDLVRLVRRMLTDRRVPRGVRVMLSLLVAYLASPVDLVPDFVPVLGYADDVILALLVLRRAFRRTGPGVVRDRWPGSSEALTVLLRACGASPLGDSAPRVRPDETGDGGG